MELPPPDVCYRALASRDPRFDGRLFVGVKTTGVYCRPICPARTAKPANCRFFASAAAAHEAGFRPCLRCRPESSCDAAAWKGTCNTVARGLALIGEGAWRDEDGVGALAARLGVGDRHLRRLFDHHLGAPPIAVAQTRRILFAKQLLHETRLSMGEVALASGFGSVRRFNDAFDKLFGRPPTSLRKRRSGAPSLSAVTLRLGYRRPYDWDEIRAFLAAGAIDGVEVVEPGLYARTIELDEKVGSVEVSPGRGHLTARIRFPEVRALLPIVARLRRLFDLDADAEVIGAHLSSDPFLAPLVVKRPGLRAPGTWDGFEFAVRAVLGQQVTVGAARRLASKLADRAGRRLSVDQSGDPRLTRAFPSAAGVASADLTSLGIPRARIASLLALAQAAMADPNLTNPVRGRDEAVARLREVPGFGVWSAEYWALRAPCDSDAFPASDVALQRSAAAVTCGPRPTSVALLATAERWRPWRAYAAQHLWVSDRENGHVD